jgi:hypothetical protein
MEWESLSDKAKGLVIDKVNQLELLLLKVKEDAKFLEEIMEKPLVLDPRLPESWNSAKSVKSTILSFKEHISIQNEETTKFGDPLGTYGSKYILNNTTIDPIVYLSRLADVLATLTVQLALHEASLMKLEPLIRVQMQTIVFKLITEAYRVSATNVSQKEMSHQAAIDYMASGILGMSTMLLLPLFDSVFDTNTPVYLKNLLLFFSATQMGLMFKNIWSRDSDAKPFWPSFRAKNKAAQKSFERQLQVFWLRFDHKLRHHHLASSHEAQEAIQNLSRYNAPGSSHYEKSFPQMLEGVLSLLKDLDVPVSVERNECSAMLMRGSHQP